MIAGASVRIDYHELRGSHIMRKPIRCIFGMHRNLWKTNADGERYKQCSRCGRDGGVLANEGITPFETLSRGDVGGGGAG